MASIVIACYVCSNNSAFVMTLTGLFWSLLPPLYSVKIALDPSLYIILNEVENIVQEMFF